MNKDQIISAVRKYIRDDNAKYALLINGPWGCGKTFLYENFLTEEINKNEMGKNKKKTNIYISLYGLSSIEELSKELLTSFIIYSGCKGNSTVKKYFKTTEGIISILSKSISISAGPVSIEFRETLQDIQKMIKTKNLVVCFDDFERCAIPINEVMGFINNLIEHCNCKVIILADEDNIGKMFANSNVEQKYLSVLMGGRKIITEQTNKQNQDSQDIEITVDRLKEMSEKIYSENYIYLDIKEKVVGKTLYYNPDIKEIIRSIIEGAHNQVHFEGDCYEAFILNHLDKISANFTETYNKNIRTVILWISLFKKIYDTTRKYWRESKYYECIILDFVRYSIWAIVTDRTNIKITSTMNRGSIEMVYYKGHPYTGVVRFHFIDAFFRTESLNEEELGKEFRIMEEKHRYDEIYQKNLERSKGEAFLKLIKWYYMRDEEVEQSINQMIKELKDGKYVYEDYSSLLKYLIIFRRIGLYKGEICDIQKDMIQLIENDLEVHEDTAFQVAFDNDEDVKLFNEIYSVIARKRKKRNTELGKEDMDKNHIYESASAFLEECTIKRDYYSNCKSFMEFIDIDKLVSLVNNSNNEGIYNIREGFHKVYFMGNAKEFFEIDKEQLQELIADLKDEKMINSSGITRKYAIDNLISTIEGIIRKL